MEKCVHMIGMSYNVYQSLPVCLIFIGVLFEDCWNLMRNENSYLMSMLIIYI